MIEGNLLDTIDTPGYSTAHCVGKDMIMGAGIAKKIKEKLNLNTTELRQNCQVTSIVPLKVNEDFLLNMVTKNKSNELPNWHDFKQTIKKLQEVCKKLKIQKLAIPKIGCGLDMFKWPNVMKLLKSVFYHSDTEVYVCCYDVDAEPTYRRSQDGKSKIRMKVKKFKKVSIIGDSHVRNIDAILNADKPDGNAGQSFFIKAQPGATTGRATKNPNMTSAHLEPHDDLIIITGTNDIDLQKNEFNLFEEEKKYIISQAKHTRVTILTAPYRYDQENANELIKKYNEQLVNLIEKVAKEEDIEERVLIVDINHMSKNDYGLHLNQEGKRKLCSLVKEVINTPLDTEKNEDVDEAIDHHNKEDNFSLFD